MPAPGRRTGRSRSARRADVRARLLDAVEEMLAEGTSFAAISVGALASRAGMSRASFYIHFQDKIDLLEDWLLESRRDLLEAAQAWHRADPSLSRDQLRTALAGIVHTYRARMALMGAAHEIALYDAGMREDFAQAFEEHFAGLREHIVAGQRSGDVVPALPPAETAEWLVVMLERAPPNLAREASGREIAAHVDAVTEIVWDTLYAAAPNRA